MKSCPYRGCRESIAPEHFLCPRHWVLLSGPQRRLVLEAFQQYQRDDLAHEELLATQQRVLDTVQGRV